MEPARSAAWRNPRPHSNLAGLAHPSKERGLVNRRQFVISSGSACLAAAAARISVRAEPAPHYRCGARPATPSEDIQASRVIEALRAHGVTFRYKTVIPVRFHIIHVG